MTRLSRATFVLALAFICLAFHVSTGAAQELKTQNVVLITTDGLRWQDVFTGADPVLMNKRFGGCNNAYADRQAFWRDTPEERREVLMPFFWKTIAKNGQIFGNKNKGSSAHVTNDKWFSYPGYNEILTGFADPRIVSNDKALNPNVSVLEWLHNKPAFAGRVAAFSAWGVMPFILNRPRCGFPVMGGWERVPEANPNPRLQMLNELIAETTPANNDEVYDAFVFQAALEHLRAHQPRVLFLSFLETDHWGHAGRYDNILNAAHSFDGYVSRLWGALQSMDQYRDKTTLIITTDHGRGSGNSEWPNHGRIVAGSGSIWMAFMGPDTAPLGERSDTAPVTQSQIAATLAAFLGEDYRKDVSRAGEPIADVLGAPAVYTLKLPTSQPVALR